MAQAQDPELQQVLQLIHDPPEDKKQIPATVRPYLVHLDEIREAEGVLLRRQCIIVPRSMRKDMKARIHEGHLGIDRSKMRAREAIYWPGMSSEIEDMISKWSICLENRKTQQREPLQPLPPTTTAWTKVGTDFFYTKCQVEYLLIVDYCKNYPENILQSVTSILTAITPTKSILARHGIAEIVVSSKTLRSTGSFNT